MSMRESNELKIFRKMSIEYLKRMYSNSVSYVLDKNTWRSNSPDSFGESKFLLRTRKSIRKIGSELRIFQFPMIDGVRIIYNKSVAFVFEKYQNEHLLVLTSEENYLLRDLSTSAESANDKELKIFKLSTIDKLEALYFNNRIKQ